MRTRGTRGTKTVDIFHYDDFFTFQRRRTQNLKYIFGSTRKSTPMATCFLHVLFHHVIGWTERKKIYIKPSVLNIYLQSSRKEHDRFMSTGLAQDQWNQRLVQEEQPKRHVLYYYQLGGTTMKTKRFRSLKKEIHSIIYICYTKHRGVCITTRDQIKISSRWWMKNRTLLHTVSDLTRPHHTLSHKFPITEIARGPVSTRSLL